MYAIKPWSHVALVGGTVQSYAIGIGMRWRETNCVVIEKSEGPSYETADLRRCLLPKSTLQLLIDLGCSEWKLHSILTPAKGWRIISSEGEVLRSSPHFPGSAVGQPCFHCTHGSLQRMLRTEYLRYGGTIEWGTVRGELRYNNDNTVALSKTYGMSSNLEAVVDTTPDCGRALTRRIGSTTRGVLAASDDMLATLFGSTCDVAIVTGKEVAGHFWLMPNKRVSWRLSRAPESEGDGALDGVLADLIQVSESQTTSDVLVPDASTCEAGAGKVCVLGDGLLPVDSFEFRGDGAPCMIREASLLCHEIYRQKYHRGSIAHILPRVANEVLERRKTLLVRDCSDLDTFASWGKAQLSGGEEKEVAKQIV